MLPTSALCWTQSYEKNFRRELIVLVGCLADTYRQQRSQSNEHIIARVVELLAARGDKGDDSYYFVVSPDARWYLAPDGRQANPALPSVADNGDTQSNKAALARVIAAGDGSYFHGLVWAGSTAGPSANYAFYFPPLDIIVGVGQPLAPLETALQEEVINWISQFDFDLDKSVVFISHYDGTQLVNPVRPDLVGKREPSVDAEAAASMLSGFRQAAKRVEGAYLTHQWRRQDTGQQSTMINNVRGVDDWQWIIGAGFFLDGLEAQLSEGRSLLEARIDRQVFNTVLVVVALLLVAGFAAGHLARKNARGFSLFRHFFQSASSNTRHINENALPYREFTDLAASANQMVDERQRYERAPRRSEQRFQMAMNVSENFLWELDIVGQRVIFSDGFYEFLGYRSEDFTAAASSLKQLFPEDDWLVFQAGFLNASCDSSGEGKEHRIIDAAGCCRWFVSRGGIVKSGPDDEPLKAMGTLFEITDRKKMEQELLASRLAAEQANLAKSQFLANMSHELRTPLNGVLGYAQLLQKSAGLNEEQRKAIAAIESSGSHLLHLINDILSLTATDEEYLELFETDWELQLILQDVSDAVQEKLAAQGGEFALQVDDQLPGDVYLDGRKLKQLLETLLMSIVQRCTESRVSLAVRQLVSPARLEFLVTGPAIPVAGLPISGPDESGMVIAQRLTDAIKGRLTVAPEAGNERCFYSLEVPLLVSHSSLHEGQAGVVCDDSYELPGSLLDSLTKALAMGDVESINEVIIILHNQYPQYAAWLEQCQSSIDNFDLIGFRLLLAQARRAEELV